MQLLSLFICLSAALILSSCDSGSPCSNPEAGSKNWGLLANPSHDLENMHGVYFFAGSSNFKAKKIYEAPPKADNTDYFTEWPYDTRHLNWSTSSQERDFALNAMLAANVNVVVMSYWGPPGTDRWQFWAPMQTSTAAHDELFEAAKDKNLLIMPAIESSNCTFGAGLNGNSWSFHFAAEFPWFRGDRNANQENPAPALVLQIEDLVQRYLLHPKDPQWREHWAQIYDRDGEKRYAINLLHVGSTQLDENDHETFAKAFDWVAKKVFRDTGVKVGFTLDILPEDHYAPELVKIDQNCNATDTDPSKLWTLQLKPSASKTGPCLAATSSVLAVQSFIPEIWMGTSRQDAIESLKFDFLGEWISTSIPMILDLSSGYDAHLVFKRSERWGHNDEWRAFQERLISYYPVKGLVFNSWNGYTEAMVAVPTRDMTNNAYDDTWYRWLTKVFATQLKK